MPDPIISLSDARLTLDGNAGQVEILRGISLDVARGETLGLVGPSGSGKSSLLMLLGGLERATSGRISVLGRDLTTMDEDQLVRFRRDHMGVVLARASGIIRRNSQAVNNNGSHWPVLPHRVPKSFWPMNPPATSMAQRARRLWIF